MSDWTPKGGLRYPEYLRIPQLLDLQHPVSVPPHHDETLFIIVHQAFELWFKLCLHSLDGLCLRMEQGDVRGALKLARRAATIQHSITHQIDILETMSALDFLEFRSSLEGASGFQSAQFRELEALLGLADRDRVAVAVDIRAPGLSAYFAPLMPEERSRIAARQAQPSIEERFLDLVVRRLGPGFGRRVFPGDLADLLDGHPEAGRTMLPALRALARVDDEGAAGATMDALHALPLWQQLGTAERLEIEASARRGLAGEALRRMGRLEDAAAEAGDIKLLDEEMARQATVPVEALDEALSAALDATEAQRIRARVLRRTALRAVYRRAAHQVPDGAAYELWLLAESLLDHGQAVSLYRFKHVQMVERMIGKRRGTGGSPGAAYLEKTVAYRAYPEILRVRTHL